MSDNSTPGSPESPDSAQAATPDEPAQPAPPAEPEQPAQPAASPAAAEYPPAAPVAPPAYSAPPAYDAPPPAYGTTPPAYGAAPTYGTAPAYGAAPAYGGYPVAPKTNTLAIVSLIASIAGFVIFYFIGSIVGIITGHMSLSQIKRSGEGGHGLALAGVIVGYVGLALAVLGLIAFIAFWGWVAVNVDQIPST